MTWPTKTGNKLVIAYATAALTITLAGCSSPAPLIVTSSQAEPSGMEALLVAHLEANDDGCVHARTGGGLVTLVWPRGYSVSGDRESFRIQDDEGTLVAVSGVELQIGGGHVDALDESWSNAECATEDLWMVGEIASPDGEL